MKEFRIALVCYGGVSLAVYMHGVTKEIHKLVRASAAYDSFRKGKLKANPFDPKTDTEYAYWEVLDQLEARTPMRVIVDVISGASAGGINAVFLGKALAHNTSQDHLRALWLKNASLQELTSELPEEVPWFLRWATPLFSRVTGLKRLFPEFQGAYGHLMAFSFQAAVRRQVAPPFDGDRMLGWLYDGLAAMKRKSGGQVELDSLVPPNQTLDLYVTTTDFYGYPSFIPVHDPAGHSVHDQKYRHVLRFLHDANNAKRDDFSANAELAFAARATSSLPGGFSPVQIGDLNRVLKKPVAGNGEAPVDEDDFISRQFREYGLAGADVRRTCFADGGILDNRPFSHAIRAITKRSATRQVVRRILYIDPHPISEPAPEDGRLPGTFETLLGSLSRIPKHEPVHDEIWALRAFNRRIHRINDAVESSRPVVERLVREVGETYGLELEADMEVLEKWRHAVNRHASGLELAGYASYVGFKLRSMADELTGAICQRLSYPIDSGHALFVVEVIKTWMERRRLLPVTDGVTDDQTQFLKLFDLGFRRRRVRFLIRNINTLYRSSARRAGRRPDTAELDALKRSLYDLLERYQANLLGGEKEPSLYPLMEAAFGESLLTPLIQKGRVDPHAFLDEHGDRVDAYYAALRNAIWDDKTPLHQMLSSIVAGCAGWPDAERQELLTRFVGFPFWDIMIFPLIDMGDVGELYDLKGVRMSPNDSRLIIDGGAEKKLRGVRYQHFGAFFSLYARENDYLWGRLDAAERLIDVLVDAALEETGEEAPADNYLPEKTMALDAILNAEESHLKVLKSRISALRRMLKRSKAPHGGS